MYDLNLFALLKTSQELKNSVRLIAQLVCQPRYRCDHDVFVPNIFQAAFVRDLQPRPGSNYYVKN